MLSAALLCGGCGDRGAATDPAKREGRKAIEAPPSAESAPPQPHSNEAAAVVKGPPTGPDPGAWTPPAGPPCKHPCALLTEHDWDYVRDNYCALCKDFDDLACELDWPSSDVLCCSEYDVYRNCIYAWYGYPFGNPTWRKRFEATDWYRVNPDFKTENMSPAARRNVERLKTWRAKGHICEPCEGLTP